MKKLLLHLGYPKCASTTLQNGLFYALHKGGAVNFIGRAWESDYFGPAENKKDYKAWFESVFLDQDEATARRVHERAPLSFSEDKLNLISEGLFLMREQHDDQLVIPEKIGAYFRDKVDEMQLLFVIRSQQTMIMSYFVQNYRHIKESTFSAFLDNHLTSTKPKNFKIFNLHDVLSRYAQVVGKDNLRIVYYEDLLNDREAFQRDLGAVLGVGPDLVGSLIEKPHLNKTKKEEKGSVVRKFNRLSVGEKVKRVLATGDPRAASSSAPREKIVVPPITEEQKRVIFDTFRDGNLKIADELGLDKERMERYGYF
ncbi:MAG: hypothetical protein ACR2PM_09320 [Hyphomicrobiales bacterium]